MAKHQIGERTVVFSVAGDSKVYLTRPSIITGNTTTMGFEGVDIETMLEWVTGRAQRANVPMIQDAFPQLNNEEREFILSGVTPNEWKEYIATKEDEHDQ